MRLPYKISKTNKDKEVREMELIGKKKVGVGVSWQRHLC